MRLQSEKSFVPKTEINFTEGWDDQGGYECCQWQTWRLEVENQKNYLREVAKITLVECDGSCKDDKNDNHKPNERWLADEDYVWTPTDWQREDFVQWIEQKESEYIEETAKTEKEDHDCEYKQELERCLTCGWAVSISDTTITLTKDPYYTDTSVSKLTVQSDCEELTPEEAAEQLEELIEKVHGNIDWIEAQHLIEISANCLRAKEEDRANTRPHYVKRLVKNIRNLLQTMSEYSPVGANESRHEQIKTDLAMAIDQLLDA